MPDPTLEVSIVVPVYRSEKILPELVQQISEALRAAQLHATFELILVNDCSPDGSWRVIEEIAKTHAYVKGISLARNFGQHNATMAGLNIAAGKIVVVMDDDLQHPPESIFALIEAIRGGHDVCYTRYVGRKHPLWKRVGSWFNDRVASFLLKKPKNLYLSSYKALHHTVVAEMVRYDGPYAYLDGLILDATRNITVLPIQHRTRFEGEGNYGLSKSISLWLRMATSFSVVPLRLASLVGVTLAAISAIVMLVVIVEKILHPETAAGWASMVTIVLFMGGVQLLCLGIMGEYLGRAYLKLNHKPQFVIRSTTFGDALLARDLAR